MTFIFKLKEYVEWYNSQTNEVAVSIAWEEIGGNRCGLACASQSNEWNPLFANPEGNWVLCSYTRKDGIVETRDMLFMDKNIPVTIRQCVKAPYDNNWENLARLADSFGFEVKVLKDNFVQLTECKEYPSVCTKCGSPAYIGLFNTECSNQDCSLFKR